MKVFRIPNFRKILLVVGCIIFFAPNFKIANCMDRCADKAAFNYNTILKSNAAQNVIIKVPPEIEIIAQVLQKEYFTLIENQYLLGEKYSSFLISWRKKVFNHYQSFQKLYGNQLAIYFLLTINKECHKEHHIESHFLNFEKSKVYLITPSSQENAILHTIASDPNGSIQIRLYYDSQSSIQKSIIFCI